MPKPIVVIGSINMDLVCRVPARPKPGETILGEDFVTIPGGKGANQAVAAARLGGDVHMIGRVGDDDFGKQLRAGLKDSRVNVDHVRVTPGQSSGVAMIMVDARGQNSIVVASGANARLTKQDVTQARDLIASAAAVVLQLEIPLAVVRHAAELCRQLNVYTILDPAPVPAKGLPSDLFNVDVITPNESEAELLLKDTSAGPREVAAMLVEKGARHAVLKRGARGAMWLDRGRTSHRCAAFKVKVVDTTAAGDAFTGALAVARSEDLTPAESLRLACASGALCCTGFGAQPALPTRKQVDQFMLAR